MVTSLDRLKEDLSKMVVRQEPDVIFTEGSNASNDRSGAVEIFDGGDRANANNADTRKGGGSGGGGSRSGEGSGSSSGGGGGKTVGAHLAILR